MGLGENGEAMVEDERRVGGSWKGEGEWAHGRGGWEVGERREGEVAARKR